MTNIAFSWTEEEVLQLRELREQDELDWDEIAAKFPGKTARACRSQYERLRARPPNTSLVNIHKDTIERLLKERDRRLAARAQQSEADLYLGVPAPGYSALDKKRAQVA